MYFLTPFRGSLPTNEAEYRQFTEYVKRFGHLAEAGSHAINQGATHGPSVLASWAFPTAGGESFGAPQAEMNPGFSGSQVE